MDQHYYEWAFPYYVSLPACGIVLLALPYIPIAGRKVLLAFTRIRQRLSVRTRFSETFRNELSKHYAFKLDPNRAQYTLLTLREILLGLEEYLNDPITLAFISTCIRSAPYMDWSSSQEVKEATIEKEIQAALDESYNATLNYQPLFSDDPVARQERIFPNLPLNPVVHSQLYNAFQISKRSLQGRILYPQMSDKTIGRSGQEFYQYGLDLGIDQLYSMTDVRCTADVERYYHLWGVYGKGVVEMRCAWKYNDLKPRVYYAQGPDCYAVSKYVQEIFNSILDHFEVVHRHNRYERPIAQFEDPDDRLAIYDYTSFTSSLEQVKAFTRELACFYRGTSVVVVDTYMGPVIADVGDLLLQYTEVCNEAADFDIHRILALEDIFVVRHTTGMLGVPGNISSCTLLHGLHLIIALGGVYMGRCVGDDAIAIILGGSLDGVWDAFIDRINNLGRIAREKFEYWDWHDDPDTTGSAYCKRPIARLENSILFGIALIWPAIENLIPLKDQYHKVSFASPSKITKTFIAQWSRLLTRLETFNIEPSEGALTILSIFQNDSYRRRGLANGGMQYVSQLKQSLICPKRLHKDEFGQGWKQITIAFIRQNENRVELPVYARNDEVPVLREGVVFHSRSTRLLGLLEKLGYLEKTLERERYDLAQITSYEFLSDLISLSYPFSYQWSVLVDCPKWVDSVSYLELMSPHERISNTIYTI